MTTIKEWQESINKMSPADATRKAIALSEVGCDWPLWEKEFVDGSQVRTLYFMLRERSKECDHHFVKDHMAFKCKRCGKRGTLSDVS